MVLPSNANVYYAINTSCDLNFILRPKGESSSRIETASPGSSSMVTPTRPLHKDSTSAKDSLKARKKILSLGM